MNRSNRLATVALCLGLPLVAVLPSPVRSETAPQAMTTPQKAKGHHGEHAGWSPERMAAMVDKHLASLRADLHITPAQEPQWEAFAKVSRDNATDLHARFADRGTRFGTMTAADNMMDFARISALHAEHLMRLAEAFRTLYASLTPEQQKAADASFREAQGRHGHGPMGRS